jgi:hypothetical protein
MRIDSRTARGLQPRRFMTIIDDVVLAQVTGGAGAVNQTLSALQSKFGGGGWISLNGRPKVTPGASADVVRGSFKTEPWEAGNPAVNRSFTTSVPHHGTWDQVNIGGVRVLRR